MRFAVALAAVAFLALPGGAAPAGAPAIVIAVVDSGVTAGPALAPLLVGGYNAVDGSADSHDEFGHGTGVAEVVAGGIAAGGCERCRIMPVKIADASRTSTQWLAAEGIRWAVAHGARVINLSYGLSLGVQSTHAVEAAIADAVAHGASVATGAMNDGSHDPRANPWASGSPGAVRVTAVDAAGRLLPASNHGLWVEIGAPGTATSNATPRVAAVIARMLAVRSLTPRFVKAALRRGCRPRPSLDVAWHCVLDADGALAAAASPPPRPAR